MQLCENAEVIKGPVYVCVEERRFETLIEDLDKSTRLREKQALVIASTGHNLRQHLQTVLMAADLVVSEAETNELRAWASLVKRHVELLRLGLERLVLESGLEDTAQLPTLEGIEIGDVLNETRLRWSEKVFAKGLRFNVDFCNLRVRSHRFLLLSILDNLLSNALTHTHHGSITIRCFTGDTFLLVRVCDTGCGMTEQDVQRIFDPFWQGALGTTGMGVGLTIVKRAASLLSHEIAVDSVPGKGTSLTLKIALATPVKSMDDRHPQRNRAF